MSHPQDKGAPLKRNDVGGRCSVNIHLKVQSKNSQENIG